MNIKDVPRFECHSHSEYSNIRLLDCINRPKDLLLMAHKLGYSGLTITDHECLSGHVQFLTLEKELKKSGQLPEDFKLGLGNEIYLVDERKMKQRYFHFILIAKDTIGHRALRELSSKAWYNSYFDRGMERVPTLKSELVEVVNRYKGHLIASTACIGGELAHLVYKLVDAEKGNNEEEIYNAKKNIFDFLNFFKELFGDDFYVEIAPGCSKDQIIFNERVKSIAKGMGFKMIFTTDAHYLTSEYRGVHKAFLNSKEGEREVDAFYAYAHLMDNEEAFGNLYPYYSEEECIEMCNNTVEIMNKIKGYDLFHSSIIPEVEVTHYDAIVDETLQKYPTLFKLRGQGNEQEKYWVNECLLAMEKKDLVNDEYLSRLEIEASVIDIIGHKLDNCLFSYFNTFRHYIDLFWECGSLSGPGRGSSVCFLSNYLLGITQLDPLEWKLDYWRFLNEERVELP